MTTPEVRVFTLHQPFATAMALNLKRNETRCWSTNYRGWIAIHSAKSGIPDYGRALLAKPEFRRIFDGVTMHHGHVLAVVRLRACHTTTSVEKGLSATERMLGDYSPGRFAWMTGDLHKLETPIKYSNGQGLRHATQELVNAILEQCRLE